MIKNFTAKKIKEAVKETGFTQGRFAKKIGIGESMISQWLAGTKNPTLTSLKKIADATNKPLNFFIENTGNTQEGNTTTDATDIMKKYISKLEQEVESLKQEVMRLKRKV